LTRIYALRVVGGRERLAIKAIERKVRAKKIPIKALLTTEQVKGYVFVEATNVEAIKMILDVPYVMKRLYGKIPFESIKRFIVSTPMVELLHVGDVVEIISGPFKGQQANVESINKKKNTIKISLSEATTPFTVTMSAEAVKLID